MNGTQISHRALGLAVVAACVPALAVAAPSAHKPAVPGAYSGKTSRGFDVKFRVVGGKVKGFRLTAQALCLSVAAANSYLDPVLHAVTPKSAKLRGDGTFKVTTRLKISSTVMRVSGRLNGSKASGKYHLGYTTLSGSNIYACQADGKWKATRK